MSSSIEASRYVQGFQNESVAHSLSPTPAPQGDFYNQCGAYVASFDQQHINSFYSTFITEHFHPQSGFFRPLELLDEYVQQRHLCVLKKHTNTLIQVSNLILHLQNESATWYEKGLAIVAFISAIGCNPSHLMLSCDVPPNFLTELSSIAFELSDSGEVQMDPHALSVVDCWRLLKSNPIFPKLSLTLTVACVALVCSIEAVSFEKSYVELVSDHLSMLQSNALEIVDAVVESIHWSCTTGLAVIKSGSLAPILYSDQTIREFDDLFMKVHSLKNSAINGSLQDLSLFEKDLERCLEIVDKLNKCKIDHVIRRYLHEKYAILVGIQEQLYVKRKNCEMRFCPIGFSLFGGSGVGKTTVAKMVMNTSLFNMGYSVDPSRQITLDMSDKYHSTLTNDVEGIFFDDLANAKVSFSQNGQIPSSLIIKFFNNVPAQAIKADVSDKGKTMVNLKCGVVTTNQQNLDMNTYSNCPVSIMRRLFHITVRIKPKYQQKKNGQPIGMLDQQHPELLAQKRIGEVDVWSFDLHTAIPKSCGRDYIFQILDVDIDGRIVRCESLNLKDLLFVVKHLSECHKKQQDTILRGCSGKDMDFCSECGMMDTVCSCSEPHSGYSSWFDVFGDLAPYFGYVPVSSLSSEIALRSVLRLTDTVLEYNILPYVPEQLYNHWFVQQCLHGFFQRACEFDWKIFGVILSFYDCVLSWLKRGAVILVPSIFLLPSFYFIGIIFFWIVLYLSVMCIRYILYVRKKKLEEKIVNSRDTLSVYGRYVRDNVIESTLLVSSGVLAAIIGIRFLYKMYRTTLSAIPQSSSLTPENIARQTSWYGNLFSSVNQRIVTKGDHVHLSAQVIKNVQKNLFFCRFVRDDKSETACCVFFPKSNVVVFPKHIFYPGTDIGGVPCEELVCYARNHPSPGGAFTFTLSFSQCAFSDDLAVAYVPSCPSIRDVIHLFPDSLSGQGYGCFIRRMPTFECNQARVFMQHCFSAHKYAKFFGSLYSCDLVGNGACMSVLVSDSKPSSIVGFHIAGKGSNGTSIFLSHSVLESLIKKITTTGVVIGADNDYIPNSSYNRPYLVGPVHSKSFFLSLDKDTCFDALGLTKLRMQTRSDVVPSLLHSAIYKECDITYKWKAPNMLPNWKHFNAYIGKITKPSLPFSTNLLEKSVRDYTSFLLPCSTKYHGLKRCLSMKEAILGIPGMRFCDPLNMSTSMGFPIFGSKRSHFSDVLDDHGILVDRIPSEEILVEYNRIKNCYSSGKRAYPVFTACLKDEVKDFDSEKVRVFTASPVAFSIVVREYFLPLAMFFQFFPLESEMAVGINAFGTQWQDLMEHVEQYSKDGGGNFGMDYSSYDTRMNSQLSRAAYSVFIELAYLFNYPTNVIDEMRCAIDDLVYPLVDINGTLVQLYHTNPSGNNITVQVNCIVNSLYLRLAFFFLTKSDVPFRDVVSLTTYGDDNKGSVRTDFRKVFNFRNIKNFFLKHDITITAPDKSHSDTDFFPVSSLDFLKRQSHYIAEIDRIIGRLEEKSILKSLCYNVKSSSATETEVAVSCVDGALHEWFAFGRDHYEKRRKQLFKVFETVDIPPCPSLLLSFDDRVKSWKDTYIES